MPPDRPAAPDPLARLPAERGQRKDDGIVLYACCCCCCCCCCLHTVGGAIGVALSGNYRGEAPRTPDEERDEFYDDDEDYFPVPQRYRARPRRRLPGVQGLFWTSLLIVILLQVVIGGILGILNGMEPVLLALATPCALIMLGPLYLFAACIVLVIRVAVNPALRRHDGYFLAALKIFGGAFAGSLAGMLIMIVPIVLIVASR